MRRRFKSKEKQSGRMLRNDGTYKSRKCINSPVAGVHNSDTDGANSLDSGLTQENNRLINDRQNTTGNAYLGVRVKMPVKDMLRNIRIAKGLDPRDTKHDKASQGEKKRVNTSKHRRANNKKSSTKSLEELAIIVEVLEEDLKTGRAYGSSHRHSSTEYCPSNASFSTEYCPSNASFSTEYSPSNASFSTEYCPSNASFSTEYSPSNASFSPQYSPSNASFSTEYSPSNASFSPEYSPSDASFSPEYSSSNSSFSPEYSPEPLDCLWGTGWSLNLHKLTPGNKSYSLSSHDTSADKHNNNNKAIMNNNVNDNNNNHNNNHNNNNGLLPVSQHHQQAGGFNSDDSDDMTPSPQSCMSLSPAEADSFLVASPPNLLLSSSPATCYEVLEDRNGGGGGGTIGGTESQAVWAGDHSQNSDWTSTAFFWSQLQREETQLREVSDSALLAVDQDGRTALHRVVGQGKRALAYAIAKRMAAIHKLDLKDSDGRTALHLAAKQNQHLMVMDLISLGASVNERDGLGKTCSHLCAENGYIRVLEVLKHMMKDGLYVDLEATDNCGMSIFQCTSVSLYSTIEQMERCSSPGESRLHSLRLEQLKETLECLLQMDSSLLSMDHGFKENAFEAGCTLETLAFMEGPGHKPFINQWNYVT